MTQTTPAQILVEHAERRRHRRYPGIVMAVTVNGRPASLIDISEGGIRAACRSPLRIGERVEIALAAPGQTPGSMTAVAEVKSAADGKASLAFLRPTYTLMRFVIHYLARRHGVRPHIF